MSLIQITLIAMIFIIIIVMAMVVLIGQNVDRKKRIMAVVQGDGASKKAQASDNKDQNKRREGLSRKLKENKGEEDNQKKKIPVSVLLGQAGLDISLKKYWVFSAISMCLFVLMAKLMGYSIFVLIMTSVIGFFGFPKFVLKFMAGKRQKKFLEEFPDALEATVRLLKAGMPVSEAVLMISKEFTGPVGEEMSRIYDKQKIGVALHEAALEATKRMPLPEMQMFATGLAIQAQTGSSLSEVLMNLSNVIRSRFRLKRKIKALSSEAIASASIIGALPLMVGGGMYFVNYDYIMILFTTFTGKMLLTGAGVWMFFGIVAMKIMINFKI